MPLALYRPGRLALAVLAIGVSLGCDSLPTKPETAPAPQLSPARRDVTGPTDIPAGPQLFGPVAIPLDPLNAYVTNFQTGITIPAYSSFVVTVEGQITVSPNPHVVECFGSLHNPPYGQEGTWGPGGTGYYDFMKVYTSVGLDYHDPAVAKSDTLWTWYDIQLTASRNGIYAYIGQGGNPGCENVGFYMYSGTQTVSAQTIEGADLTLTPKSVMVKKGTTVRFTGRDDQGVITLSPNWTFTPAPGVTDSRTVGCGLGGPNPCDVVVWNNGTLRIANFLKGRMHGASSSVRVYTSLTVEGDKSQVAAGEQVEFTPMVDGVAGSALSWRWRGDDKSSVADPCSAIVSGKCRYSPTGSGAMWAYTSDDSAMAYVNVTAVGGGGCSGANAQKNSVTPAASTKLAPNGSITRDCSDDGNAPASVVIDEAPNGGGYPVSRMLPSETIDIGDKFYSTMNFRVRVLDGHGAVVPNADVHLALEVAELSGGHDHESPDLPRSAGSFGDGPGGPVVLDVNTGGTGQVVFTYQSPDQSGSVTLLAKTGTVSGFQKVLVEFPGLVPLSPIPGYLELVGTDAYHKERYWVDREEMQQLQYMAIALVKEFADDDVCAGCTRHLGVNDASLPFGGQFDVHGNWRKPHADHRQGQGADIRITDKSEDQIKFMRDYWELDMDGHVYDESLPGTNPSSTGPHYHFMRCKGECNH